MNAARFGLFIIGDEILSGKRADKHLSKVIELLGARGLRLAWAQYLGDDRELIANAFRRSFASDDVVFSCGGIGATPDDHTRQAAALALNVDVVLHPEAEALITQRCVEMGQGPMHLPENQQRLKMGEFPRGAQIIPNSYNKIPGFSLARHYFVPGFPVMAWPMIEWVLDTHYHALFNSDPQAERSMLLFEVPESRITPLMEDIERQFDGLKTFSLPSVGDGRDGKPARRHIELGVKGSSRQRERIEAAFDTMCRAVAALGGEYQINK